MYFMYFLPHFWGRLIGHHWSCSTVEEAGKEQLQWGIIFRFIYLLSKILKEPNDVTLPCEWQEG